MTTANNKPSKLLPLSRHLNTIGTVWLDKAQNNAAYVTHVNTLRSNVQKGLESVHALIYEHGKCMDLSYANTPDWFAALCSSQPLTGNIANAANVLRTINMAVANSNMPYRAYILDTTSEISVITYAYLVRESYALYSRGAYCQQGHLAYRKAEEFIGLCLSAARKVELTAAYNRG